MRIYYTLNLISQILGGDVFGSGKVLIMGEVFDREGKPYEMDTRGLLKKYVSFLKKEKLKIG